MNLIRLAIDRPIAVIAAVLMVVMFGLVSLQSIPIQLTPDVRKPVITITTGWPGAAPAEIEREIVNRQEEALKGLEGLHRMESRSQDSEGELTLEFDATRNMDQALLLVSNRLDRVTDYPDEADEPRLKTASAEDSPIAWFILRHSPGNLQPIHTYRDFVEDMIQDRIERVPGVSRVNLYGGSEREMQVVVDPEKMARYGLTVPDVVRILRQEDASISAGDIDEGKRRYVVRTEGELNTIARVRSVVLRSEEDPLSGRLGRVTVGDIAEVRFGYKDPAAHLRVLGEPALAFNAVRETGANVIETMQGIREAVAELNAGPIPAAGLILEHVYDETVYIDSAIELVQQNIYIGGTLAALVLMLFLRSLGATLIVSLAIPVSVIGSFIAMALLGRSINVISLAGIAFAVGMVVDAAIVVLENIYRLRQEGKPAAEAAYRGAKQVWSAVLVSALTTVLVFVPILVMELEVGQLFRDIAVAISVAVLLSLVVSITVIPTLATKLLGGHLTGSKARLRIPLLDDAAEGVVAAILGFTRFVVKGPARALLVVGLVCGLAALASVVFLPKLDYLPEGNRNLVFGIILPPPGYNLDTTTAIARDIEDAVRPTWASETGPESTEGEPPKMERFFFVALRSQAFVGAVSVDPARAGELIPVVREPVFKEPGTFGYVTQTSLFGRGIGGGRSIELDVSGPHLQEILDVALRASQLIEGALPQKDGNQFRPIPGLELGAPEVRLIPDAVRLADNGLTTTELGQTIDAFNDGLRISEITVGSERIDLMLKGPERDGEDTQTISNLPVVTRSGVIVPADQLSEVSVTAGPTEIRHAERSRTVTLEIRPAPEIPLELALDTLKSDVVDRLRAQGLPPGVSLNLTGTADELSQTWDAMVINLILAVAIVYLFMAVLFESFIYPFIILLSVPLATAGGVGGLAILNLKTFQPLDMLTLLGFVILVGIVVNNAILLVHQTLYNVRTEGLGAGDAIVAATRNRIRPIFMSTLTSVVGMLPLVLFPGAGSELYRGLGSVVVGGLALSAIMTLVIIPPLLSITVPMGERRRLARRKALEPSGSAAE
jgi:HAE1 family hydrophobic/amphiphilic exporter-1